MKFSFKARNNEGKVLSGTVEALNQVEAASVLQQKGLVPVQVVTYISGTRSFDELKRVWEGANQKDLVILFRQMAALISAKVPVLNSLRTIQYQTDNHYLRSVLKNIADSVEDGTPLSEGMSKYPLVFSPLVVSMIRSGEVSGNLQNAINHVADTIEKNYDLTSKIRGALFYPSFVIAAAFIIGFIVITFILPKITTMIKELNVEAPWYTKVVMSVGDFMASYWWAVLIVLIAAAASFWYYVQSEAGRKEWDIWKLKLPIIGSMFRSIYIARFSDNLSILLTSGIPLVRSLIIVSNVVNNFVMQGVILRAADEVKKGGSISSVFRKSPEIPPIVSQMVEIGEESGQLSETLKSTSDFYTREVDNKARNLTTMIEPVLIVILGIGVAILVFAVLLPIYSIVNQL